MEDLVAISLICLTIYVCIIRLISRDDDFSADKEWEKFFRVVVLVGAMCIMVFTRRNIFFFFFFFERSLLPTIVLILG